MTANEAINTLRRMNRDMPLHKPERDALGFGVMALYAIALQPERIIHVNAAAPEMLEALKEIRKLGYGSALQKSGAVILQLVQIAEDAILKAEPNPSEGERRQIAIDGDHSEEPQHKKGKL